MKTCPKCQTVLNDTAKFCRKCGLNIKQYEEENAAQESFCTECGAKIPSDSVFCPECGTSIGSELACDTVSTETIGGFDFSALELEAHNQLNEQNLSAFEYEKLSNGKYVIKKLKNSDELIVVVPDCVQVIGAKAFEYSSVIEVTLPEGLIKIGAGAFSRCKDLKKINIPSSLEIIDDEAFWGCTQLDLQEPQNVRCGKDAFKLTKQGFQFVLDGNSYKVEKYYGASTDVIIPKKFHNLPVTSIGSAFCSCSSLTSITIPNSVTGIGGYAFQYCTSLTSITIPNSVTSIGKYVFSCCSSLTSITIPNSVTRIDDDAFYSCSSLTSIKIPNSVTSIGERTFYDCRNLTSITIPNSVTSIGKLAFNNCRSLTSITIPNSVTSIGGHAFQDCTSLTSITIPNSVTSIGDYAFSSCTSLTNITIPNSVTSIDGAFQYCTSLTSITIPNNVKSIGKRTFYDCRNLTSITIPNSVTSIGESAFGACRNLTSITFKGTQAQWRSISFGKDWRYVYNYAPTTKVICSDGIIVLS